MIIEGSAPSTLSRDDARSTSQRPAVQTRVLGDVTNTSASLLAAGDPKGAKRRGRKPGQKNFEKFSDLPARAKSTRRRSAPVPSDHAGTALAPSIPRPARPVAAATRPAVAPVRAVVAAASLDEPPARPASRPPRPLVGQKRGHDCLGAYSGAAGAALSFAARAMIGTGQTLLRYAAERDGGLRSFAASALGTTRQMLLPQYGLVLQRAVRPEDGFTFRSVGCSGCTNPEHFRSTRCDSCRASSNNAKQYARKVHAPQPPAMSHNGTNVRHIVSNPTNARLEIERLRREVKRLRRAQAREVFRRDLAKNGRAVDGAEMAQVRGAINAANAVVQSALSAGGAVEELELWRIHKEHLDSVAEKGGTTKGRSVRVHPTLLNWCIAFLARTSASVYEEVRRVMKLPSVSYVYRKTAEMISTMADKAYAINIDTVREMGERADREGWSAAQRTGMLAQDSANISPGVEHDYVRRRIVGGDESHRIGSLTLLYQSMAQQVRDEVSDGSEAPSNNSIMDELRLAHEHLVFKWTSIDPNTKCSEIVASINVEKVTPEVVAMVTEQLRNTMPIYGMDCAGQASDAAGANWVAARDITATHSTKDVLRQELMDTYPEIDFDVATVAKDPVSGEWFIFIPDNSHLTKNVVTAIEKSAAKKSKRNIKYGKCPINLGMVEDIWIETGGATLQFHPTKLSIRHFDKNAYSRMNVSLAAQVLSKSVATMIRNAISDRSVKLQIRNKNMYHHLANLCEKWDALFDITNGKDEPHTPTNAVGRQQKLLDILKWFSNWKANHDGHLATKKATEYNFFADETWFCIRALILAHVCVIEIFCIQKKVSVNPKSMNTDTVEWTFGDERQMVGGSHNKLTALGFDRGDKKSNAFNAAKCRLVGNNKDGENFFQRKNKY